MLRLKPLLYTTVGILVVLIAFNTGVFVQRKKTSSVLQKAIENENTAKVKAMILERYYMLSVQSSGKIIDDYVLLTDLENNTRSATDIFVGKVLFLVFRYSQGACSSCINTVFEYLWALKKNVDEKKLRIIIVPYYAELRQMIVENSQSFKNQFQFYLAEENGIGLPIDKASVPYLFLINENKQVTNVFVIDMMFQSLLEKYVNTIIEDFK